MTEKNINKQSMQNITKLFGLILFLLLIILFLLRIIIIYTSGLKFNLAAFVDDLSANILGTLLALLIFNLGYEYFMRIYSSHEISKKITETIMSNKEIIDTFEINAKKQFIKTTLQSILQIEKGNVVYEIISPYLKSKLNLRKEYKYTIRLEEINPENCKWAEFFNINNYNLIRESLSYTTLFTGSYNPEYFNIGFFRDEKLVDSRFQDKNSVFRENLYLDLTDLEKIKTNKENFIKECMNLKFHINGKKIDVYSIEVNESGILVTYKASPDFTYDVTKFDLTFSMPQLKSKNSFQIAVIEPTYKPYIKFIYPSELYHIAVFPFFDENFVNVGISDLEGIKEIELDNWIIPRSGAVFIWHKF